MNREKKHEKEKKQIDAELNIAKKRYWDKVLANLVRANQHLDEYQYFAVEADAVDELKQINMFKEIINSLVVIGLKKTEDK